MRHRGPVGVGDMITTLAPGSAHLPRAIDAREGLIRIGRPIRRLRCIRPSPLHGGSGLLWMERGLLDWIDWRGVLTQALQTGGALVMLVVAWTLPRAVWRGGLWWFNSGRDRSEAERAALAQLLEEAEDRGYRRGRSDAEEALNDKAVRASATTPA